MSEESKIEANWAHENSGVVVLFSTLARGAIVPFRAAFSAASAIYKFLKDEHLRNDQGGYDPNPKP